MSIPQRDGWFCLLVLFLLTACQPAEMSGTGSPADAAQSSDDADDRPNILLIVADDLGYMDVGFFGSEIRTRHSNNLERTFGKLLTAAQAVDTDEMISGALLYGSASGMLYRIIRHVRGDELMDSVMGLSEPARPGPAIEVSVESV